MTEATKEDTQRDRKPVPDQVVIRGDAAALKQVTEALGDGVLQPAVRAFAIPADAEAYGEAIDNGAIAALHKAGFVICNPGTKDPGLAHGEFGLNWPGTELAELVDSIRTGTA